MIADDPDPQGQNNHHGHPHHQPHGQPDRREWDLNVQGVLISSPQPNVVARDAIKWAGFDPDAGWIIVLKIAGQKEPIELETVIDLTRKGVEKLRLTPRKIDNGEAATPRRRDFGMLPKDEAHLDALGIEWDTALDGARRWLIVRNYPLPKGYAVSVTDIAIEVPTSYPGAKLDMFFCRPAVLRADGQTIPKADHTETIFGQTYQRWSRHRKWDSARDTLATHLALVAESLLREVEQ